MKQFFYSVVFLSVTAVAVMSCGNKEDKGAATNPVKEKVKEVVNQPFKTYEAAKDSLNASSDKTKAALEDQDKELKR